MPGNSNKTKVISLRLPNDVVEIIERRCAKNRYNSVSHYLRERIIYDIKRKHRKVISYPKYSEEPTRKL